MFRSTQPQSIRRLALAGLSAAVLVPAAGASPATAAPSGFHMTRMQLTLELTGIDVIDWHERSPACESPNAVCVEGHGTQTTGFSTPHPIPYRGYVITGVPGHETPRMELLPQKVIPPLKANQRRTFKWSQHVPTQCGGELGPCDGSTPAQPKWHCGRKTTSVTTQVGIVDQGLALYARVNPLKWTDCPPPNGLNLTRLRSAMLKDAPARLAHIRRGQTMTFKGSDIEGNSAAAFFSPTCPKLKGPGHQECATTDYTLEVHRVR